MTGLRELVLTALTGHLNFIKAINIQNKPIISTCYLCSFSTSTVPRASRQTLRYEHTSNSKRHSDAVRQVEGESAVCALLSAQPRVFLSFPTTPTQ